MQSKIFTMILSYEVSSSRKIEKDIILNDIGAMIYDTKSAKEKFLIDDTATLEKSY